MIVVIRNCAWELDRFLYTFTSNNSHYPYEIIIADLVSADNPDQVIVKYQAKAFIKMIKFKQNLPWASACNIAAAKAIYPNLLFISPGTKYSKDVLPKALKKLDKKNIGAVGIRLIDDTDLCPAVNGVFLLCRKEDFVFIGGFYEQQDYRFKDEDFCVQLKVKLNKTCYYQNDLFLQYSNDATTAKTDPALEKLEPKVTNTQSKAKDREEILVNAASTHTRKTAPALRILYVLPVDLDCSSGYHVQRIIDHLKPHGVEAVIAIPGKQDSRENSSVGHYNVYSFKDMLQKGRIFTDGQGPDLIHAWTPREVVRKFVQSLSKKHHCPVIVHLENNEEYLLEASIGQPFAELEKLFESELDSWVPSNRYHPTRGKKWLQEVQSLTMVIDKLDKFNYAGVPALKITPLPDERFFYPRPLNYDLRRKMRIPDDHLVFAYTGNVHTANCDEVLELYRAVELLNDKVKPTILLRTGRNYVPFLEGKDSRSKQYEKALDWVSREELPDIMAAADILVQPGKPGPFNDYRIPFKLPEFFALGRPVILPKTNLGLLLEHEKEAYVLQEVNAEAIAEAAMRIYKDKRYAGSLAAAGCDFIRAMCYNQMWKQNLINFYLEAVNSTTNDIKANSSKVGLV